MNQKDQRRRNSESVLGLLRANPGISQVQLAMKARLQPSTTSNLVRSFKELGVVTTVGKGDSGPHGGKKARLLALRPDFGYYGGIYLKNDEVICGITDFEGSIVSRRSVAIEPSDNGRLLDLLADEIASNRAAHDRYRATGIAVSSIVNLRGDITPSAGFSHALPAVISALESRTGHHPIALDNDANCAAFWNYHTERGRYRNLIHLQVQTSPVTIGAGIILDGILYRGAQGAAGELPAVIPESTPAGRLEDRIIKLVRFLGSFLDPQAIFIAGELNEEMIERLGASMDGDDGARSFGVHVVANQDLPMLGASLAAIGLHVQAILKEQ